MIIISTPRQMLSLEPLNPSSTAIATIKNRKRHNIIYLTDVTQQPLTHRVADLDDSESEDLPLEGVKSLQLDNLTERIAIIPTIKEDAVDKIYAAAPGGSGKTSLIRQYCLDFVKLFPAKKIYLFSDVKHDDLLDDIKAIIRIPLDESFYEQTPDPSELHDSLCIFDDIDSITDSKILKAVQGLRDAILKVGRHKGIEHIFITNHLMTDYKNTRVTLSEATHIFVFPNCGATNGVNYILKNYVGLNNKQIQSIKKLKSRWVCFRIKYPQTVITDNQVFLMDQLDDVLAEKPQLKASALRKQRKPVVKLPPPILKRPPPPKKQPQRRPPTPIQEEEESSSYYEETGM